MQHSCTGLGRTSVNTVNTSGSTSTFVVVGFFCPKLHPYTVYYFVFVFCFIATFQHSNSGPMLHLMLLSVFVLFLFHSKQLPREPVDIPPLEMFKASLDGA